MGLWEIWINEESYVEINAEKYFITNNLVRFYVTNANDFDEEIAVFNLDNIKGFFKRL